MQRFYEMDFLEKFFSGQNKEKITRDPEMTLFFTQRRYVRMSRFKDFYKQVSQHLSLYVDIVCKER